VAHSMLRCVIACGALRCHPLLTVHGTMCPRCCVCSALCCRVSASSIRTARIARAPGTSAAPAFRPPRRPRPQPRPLRPACRRRGREGPCPEEARPLRGRISDAGLGR
jgi:hypothetical protein